MPIIYKGITSETKGLHYIIKTGAKGDLTINTINGVRAIRYSPNQKSQFLDEQNDFAKVVPLIMKEGFLTIDDSNKALIEFMDMHPHKDSKFKLLDYEQEAQKELVNEELVLDIKAAIREKSKTEFGDVILSSLLVIKSKGHTASKVMTMGDHQIRKALYNLVKNKPKLFVNKKGKVTCFTDKGFIREDMIIKAVNEDIINVNPAGTMVSWESGEEILSIPRGKNYREYLSDWFLESEGEKVMNAIGTELEDLYKKK